LNISNGTKPSNVKGWTQSIPHKVRVGYGLLRKVD